VLKRLVRDGSFAPVTLLQTFEDREYLPEYGTLVVRDSWDPDARVELAPGEELLEEYATAASPAGRSPGPGMAGFRRARVTATTSFGWRLTTVRLPTTGAPGTAWWRRPTTAGPGRWS
jgi:hypothetical protein